MKQAPSMDEMDDFRKAQCGAEAAAAAAPPLTAKAAAPPVSKPVATGNAVFPQLHFVEVLERICRQSA